MLACLSRRPSSRRVRAKWSREGVPAFCAIPIIHSVQYIFAMFWTLRMKGPLEYVGQYRWFNPSFYPSLCPYIHGEKTPPARRPHHDIAQSAPQRSRVHRRLKPPRRGRKHSWECSVPVVRNQDLDHTIKPRHWTRPFTPTFDPLIEGSSWSKRLSLRGKLGAS